MSLQPYERALARILSAVDPVAAWQHELAGLLSKPVRQALQAMQPEGLRMAGLLVVNQRFTRLMRGSPLAEAWFHLDGPGFAAAFRRYHAQVPMTAFFPAAEAKLFGRWLSRQQRPGLPPALRALEM
jgi:hypothetical protein